MIWYPSLLFPIALSGIVGGVGGRLFDADPALMRAFCDFAPCRNDGESSGVDTSRSSRGIGYQRGSIISGNARKSISSPSDRLCAVHSCAFLFA